MRRVAILGTVGIPANYGGFETLAENLVRYFHAKETLKKSGDVTASEARQAGTFSESTTYGSPRRFDPRDDEIVQRFPDDLPTRLVIYCSARSYPERPTSYLGATLRYVRLNANGASSVLYDIVSLFSAVRQGCDVILLLGVSGAIALPLIRLISDARIVTNVDGIEWKRAKWKGLARWFLRVSERFAVRFSHEVIADNGGIARHVVDTYGRDCQVVAYGGDHAVVATARPYEGEMLPGRYALALCRIEPENNVAMILEAFAQNPAMPLVFVGNWNNSQFGQALKQRYGDLRHLHLLDPIYDPGVLRTLRGNAALYVHGHSAGGTNPSLVEMMHFGLPVLSFDCVFNRFTTDEQAIFFTDAEQLAARIAGLDPVRAAQLGAEMLRIARERYTWDVVGAAYFDLLAG